MNQYYKNVFNAIQYIEHDVKDKSIILKMHSNGGKGHEVVPFIKPVKAVGNIEDWLSSLLNNMRATLKELARICPIGITDVRNDLNQLQLLVDKSIAQFILLSV